MRRGLSIFDACPIPFPSKEWRCRVVDVADGDTATCLVDRGWLEEALIEVRFFGINAYELHHGTEIEKGRQARLLVQRLALGKWALLHTQMSPEKYGRILGSLFVDDPDAPDGFIDINRALLDAGLAVPYPA